MLKILVNAIIRDEWSSTYTTGDDWIPPDAPAPLLSRSTISKVSWKNLGPTAAPMQWFLDMALYSCAGWVEYGREPIYGRRSSSNMLAHLSMLYWSSCKTIVNGIKDGNVTYQLIRLNHSDHYTVEDIGINFLLWCMVYSKTYALHFTAPIIVARQRICYFQHHHGLSYIHGLWGYGPWRAHVMFEPKCYIYQQLYNPVAHTHNFVGY